MARISTLTFDRHERLKRATIRTDHGTIKVEWRDVSGERAWFTSGNLEARKLAVTAIHRIERMTSALWTPHHL